MIWDKMDCINDCTIISNLVISLVPYYFHQMVSSETIVFEGKGAETNAGPLEDLKTCESK